MQTERMKITPPDQRNTKTSPNVPIVQTEMSDRREFTSVKLMGGLLDSEAKSSSTEPTFSALSKRTHAVGGDTLLLI